MTPLRRPFLRLRLADQRGSIAAQTLAFGVLVIVLLVGAAALVAMSSLEREPEQLPATSVPPTFDEVEPAGSLDVTCGDGTAEIQVEAVNAKADGVHVAVTGAQGQRMVFQSDTGIGYAFSLRKDTSDVVLPLAPGVWRGACTAADAPPPQPGAGAAFLILDPESRFVPSAPVCIGDATDEIGPLPSTFPTNHEVAVREVLADDGVLSSDVIERAAYPRSVSTVDPVNPLVFRVLRDDVVVAHLDAIESDDGWSYHVSGCLEQS